jgi:hypothetical protein
MHQHQADPTKPTYLTSSELSRTLGYVPHMVTYFLNQWANDPDLPCPPPDAYSLVKGGYVNPLWLHSRIPEWKQWNKERKVLGRQRQREAGKRGYPGSRTRE